MFMYGVPALELEPVKYEWNLARLGLPTEGGFSMVTSPVLVKAPATGEMSLPSSLMLSNSSSSSSASSGAFEV